MNENTIAGPAPVRMMCPAASNSPAAAVPIEPKIPAPITAPIDSMIRSPAPSARRRTPSPSGTIWAMGLRSKHEVTKPMARSASDKEWRQYQRDGAQQLHEHVQRRPGCVLEWIADRIADDARLVGIGPLAAVDAGLDVLLRVVPGTATGVEEDRHENTSDRRHHQERRHRLGPEPEGLEDQPDRDRERDHQHARHH